jgi:Spy/CpxP family protein refolding chaperone
MNALGKWKLGLYVLAIFLAGGGTGAMITWHLCQRRVATPLPPAQIGARLRARFQSQLALTPDQARKIDPLIDQAMRQVQVIRSETASHVFANVSNLHEQVLTVLTPDQRAKFERLERERRDYLRQKFGPPANSAP